MIHSAAFRHAGRPPHDPVPGPQPDPLPPQPDPAPDLPDPGPLPGQDPDIPQPGEVTPPIYGGLN